MSSYRLNPDLVYREESDRGLLFDPVSGGISILNATAGFIYGLLQQGVTSREEIVAQLVATFDVQDRLAVEKDVDEFLVKLEQGRMLWAGGTLALG